MFQRTLLRYLSVDKQADSHNSRTLPSSSESLSCRFRPPNTPTDSFIPLSGWSAMSPTSRLPACLLLLVGNFVAAQQQCYFGPGAGNRGPSGLVPCASSGQSACCLLGDTCLSGNACYNNVFGNVYQYGCTDVTYQDETCPYKCGFNTSKRSLPWTVQASKLIDASFVALDGHGSL